MSSQVCTTILQIFDCPSNSFFGDLYLQGKLFMCLKQQGVLDLPITNIGNFSPIAFPTAIPVSLTLLFFPSGHFLPSKWHVLSSKHWLNKPNWTALKISFKSNFERSVGNVVSFQGVTICFATDLLSPPITLKLMLCLERKTARSNFFSKNQELIFS